jgi:hypothetical protein
MALAQVARVEQQIIIALYATTQAKTAHFVKTSTTSTQSPQPASHADSIAISAAVLPCVSHAPLATTYPSHRLMAFMEAHAQVTAQMDKSQA